MSDASSECWGNNNRGQIGDGTRVKSLTPATVVGASGMSAIALGSDHTCALTGGGVKCWGSNWSGQLGDGAPRYRATPGPTKTFAPLVRSSAFLSTSNLGLGIHTLKTWYPGDATHEGSLGATRHRVR